MTTREQQYKELLKLYDQRRLDAVKMLDAKKDYIHKTIPGIAKIDAQLSSFGVNLARAAFDKSVDTSSLLSSFEKSNAELMELKQKLLLDNGYPTDYLELSYNCNKCKDTGFIDNKPCSCFKQEQINLAYEQSNLKNVLRYENFDTFDFSYYSKDIDSGEDISPHENMQNLYRHCIHYVQRFKESFQNILFYGKTGLGKTFLCNCIAKDLLDQGHTVLYLPAVQLFQLFETARFHREDMEDSSKEMLDTLFSVDLLIIDDLGTEFITTFTGPELFNTLNTRLLTQKPTIISTNLTPQELKNYYSDRIISRIFGSYEVFRVFGQDIRLLKKYQ